MQVCLTRVLLSSTIKCNLIVSGWVTQCVNVTWVGGGDEGNVVGAQLYYSDLLDSNTTFEAIMQTVRLQMSLVYSEYM